MPILPLTWVVKASELGNDWRPEAHVRVEGLLLFQYRRVQEIDRLLAEYRRRVGQLEEEKSAIIAQRKGEE